MCIPLGAVAADWQQNNYDQQVMAAAYHFAPSLLRSENIDQAAVLANLQAFTPQVTAIDVQKSLAYLDNLSTDQIQQTLVVLQQQGFRQMILAMSDEAVKLGQSMAGYTKQITPSFTLPPNPGNPGDPGSGSGGAGNTPKPVQGDPPVAGGAPTQYDCKTDTATQIIFGIALVMVGFMAAPITGPLLVAAEWNSILLLGGLGSSAWAIGHARECGL